MSAIIVINRDLGCAISDQVRGNIFLQILEIFFSGAQFTKARMQNAIVQFLKRVERAEMAHRTGNTQ